MSAKNRPRIKDREKTASKPKISNYFSVPDPAALPPRRSKMAENGPLIDEPRGRQQTQPAMPASPGADVDTVLHNTPSPREYLCDGTAVDIGDLLRSLPTRSDIQAMVLKIEDNHRREMQELRSDIQQTDTKVDRITTTTTQLEGRVREMEAAVATHTAQLSSYTLRLEDMEDRNRRNNLRLRGMPESVEAEHLLEVTSVAFRALLRGPADMMIKIDRIHRALGPKPTETNRPRDVICRLHHYAQKEELTRRAWSQGTITIAEAQVQILPDISRATLQRRAMMRPLLEVLREAGLTYRWGFPFHLVVRHREASYAVRSPSDLPGLFQFTGIEPVSVPDWLQILPDPSFKARNRPNRRGRDRAPYPRQRPPTPERREVLGLEVNLVDRP